MSVVFYDTETTGTDVFFDQILQFAAIRTDADLNEVDRFTTRCRLLPHVVPAPGAMRVNGISAKELSRAAFPSHYQMVRAIRAKLLQWSPALFIGWNSIAFDENLIRQALYQTLHNPYLTSSLGNGRSDAMLLARAYTILAPEVLNVPTDDTGRKTFGLHQVAPANGFKLTAKHDVIADVEATIHLCRILAGGRPDVWSSLMRFTNKAAVSSYITEEQMFAFCGFSRGEPFSCIATTIGQNERNTSEWYVYDLSVPPDSLSTLSPAALAGRLVEPPLPMRRLRSNASPTLFPPDEALEACVGRDLTLEELDRRARAVQGDTGLQQRLVLAFESLREPRPHSSHIEKQIYDRFIEKVDERWMEAFHEAEWSCRNAIVDKFQDQRLRQIGRQLIYQERPELLSENIRRQHARAIAMRVLGRGGETEWLSLPNALEQLQEVLASVSGPEAELLREHACFLRERHTSALRDIGAGDTAVL
jgi:exodeoxyribonuclease-1